MLVLRLTLRINPGPNDLNMTVCSQQYRTYKVWVELGIKFLNVVITICVGQLSRIEDHLEVIKRTK